MPELNHEQYITDERLVTTSIGIFSDSQTLLKRTPIARIKASAEIVAWNPAGTDGSEKAIGLTVFEIDTTSGAKEAPYHDSGCFNPELIEWPVSTAAQKAACFDQTAIATKKVG